MLTAAPPPLPRQTPPARGPSPVWSSSPMGGATKQASPAVLRSPQPQHSPRLAVVLRDTPGRSPALVGSAEPPAQLPGRDESRPPGTRGSSLTEPRSVLGVLDGPAPGDPPLGREAERGELPKGNNSKSRARLRPELRCAGSQLRRSRTGAQGGRGGAGHPCVCVGTWPARNPLGTSCTCSRPCPTATRDHHHTGCGVGGAGATGTCWAGGLWKGHCDGLPAAAPTATLSGSGTFCLRWKSSLVIPWTLTLGRSLNFPTPRSGADDSHRGGSVAVRVSGDAGECQEGSWHPPGPGPGPWKPSFLRFPGFPVELSWTLAFKTSLIPSLQPPAPFPAGTRR